MGNKIQRLLTIMLMMLMTYFSSTALADPVNIQLTFEPDIKNGQRVYQICATCHLPEGWGNTDGGYPQIAGQHQNVLIKQLLDIRSGRRENPTMYPFVQERTIGGYQSLADVVVYISTLPMHPAHKKGPWNDLSDEYKKGKILYEKNCASCHGMNAEGQNKTSIPKLYGQHFPYVKRQIKMVREGRRVVNPAMQSIVMRLNEQQLDQIVNYISYLPVPVDKRAPSLNWRNPDFK